MSVVVKYGNIAVGAKEAFNLYATDESYFSKLSQIKEDISVFPNFGNPLERYSVALDGSVLPLPSNKEDINIGWWSEQLSNEQGIFEIPIVLEMASEEYFTGTAITITFDAPKEIYATDLSIDWYRDGELLSQKKFKPTNAKYSCENRVEFYNKIIITFNSLNRPLNRLKIKSIDHGSISTFTGGNLKKCNITQKISAISTELPISTASILLKGEAGEEYAFQKRQPLSVFSNDSLQMKLFVKKASRKSKDEWDIQAEDYVGVLDSVSFYGGIYEDESAGNLLIKIFNKAKVPYDIEADIMAETVSGYIPFGTCRNATMQVLFAVGAIIDTSNSEVIKVKRMSQDVSQKIGKERIFQGLRVVDDTRITAVSLTAHTYKAIEDSLIVYDANKSGEGVNIFVKFNEPLHDLSIQDGEILESGHNYAIINAGTNCKLNGQKYEHSSVIKTLYNDLVLSTDTEIR